MVFGIDIDSQIGQVEKNKECGMVNPIWDLYIMLFPPKAQVSVQKRRTKECVSQGL